MKNINRIKTLCLLSVTLFGMNFGCESEPQKIDTGFAMACRLSGGVPTSSGVLCVCGKNTCVNGVMCARGMDDELVCADQTNFCKEKEKSNYICKNDVVYRCEGIKQNVCSKNIDVYVWESIAICIDGCTNDSECSGDINDCEKNMCSNDDKYILECKNGKIVNREYCQFGCYINGEGEPGCAEAEEGSVCCGDENYVNRYDSTLHEWVEVVQCKSPQKCYDSDGFGGCYECETGTTFCGTITVDDIQHEIAQKCDNKKFVQLADCGLNSCIPSNNNQAAHCGVCKNGDTRCITEDNGNRGISQTCRNGEWVNDNNIICSNCECSEGQCRCQCSEKECKLIADDMLCTIYSCEIESKEDNLCSITWDENMINDNNDKIEFKLDGTVMLKCFDDNCLCADNASCTVTKEIIDNTEIEKSTCGICQNDVTKCKNSDNDHNKGVGQVYVCKNGQFETSDCQNGASCALKEGVAEEKKNDPQNWRCGECKNDNNRCTTEINGTRGIPQTCKNGEWKNDKGDDECTDDNCLCDDNASCTITKENKDDGTEVEKSTCGICQNDVDVSCIYDSNERPAKTGYRASCKNGEFVSKFVKEEECPNSYSCKISKTLTKCESNSCECNSGKETNNCAKGQYCKEELLEGAFYRKCVNAMSRCEDSVCICGNVVCNRGEFCTVDEELNDACVTALKCEDSVCPCGENKCKKGDYCKINKGNAICVDASEVITGTDWACGDCRNNDKNNIVNMYTCGDNYGESSVCQSAALTSIDSSMTNSCINSDDFFKCIEESYHVACDIQSCKKKISDCKALLTSCYTNYHSHLQAIKMCGFAYEINKPANWSGNDKVNNVYYSIKQSDKCEQTSCTCGSQSCSNGQFCFFNSECVDADKLGIAGVINFGDEKWFKCQCSESGCSCPCGNQNCSNNQFCIGNTDATKQCKSYSNLNVTYVYKCQNDSCTVCDKDNKCIDTNNQLLVYDFVDSQGYVCRSLNGQCDAYMQEQKECLANSYSVYKSCLLECAAKESKETCQNNCDEKHAQLDNNCLKSTQDNLAPILKLGDSELSCLYSETTFQSCSYECQSGRIMPFNGFEACGSGW